MDLQIPCSSAMEEEIVQQTMKMDPETELLVSKQQTGKLFKENVRPLKRGRNHSLKSHSDIQIKDSLLDTRRKLIKAIDEYEGEDPLHPWLENTSREK